MSKKKITLFNGELPIGVPIVIEEVLEGRYGYNIFPQDKALSTQQAQMREDIKKRFLLAFQSNNISPTLRNSTILQILDDVSPLDFKKVKDCVVVDKDYLAQMREELIDEIGLLETIDNYGKPFIDKDRVLKIVRGDK